MTPISCCYTSSVYAKLTGYWLQQDISVHIYLSEKKDGGRVDGHTC